MRKESTFDRVVFAAVTRQVSHSDWYADRAAQFLQVVLEQVAVRRVASSAVAQQQNACGFCVALFTNAIPVPTQTVGGKLAGIMTQANVDVTDVASNIVDAVRDHSPIGPTGEIMIERLQRRGAVQPSFAIQPTEELFGFGVNGEDRIAITFVQVSQFADAFKLLLTIRRASPGDVLSDLTQTKADFAVPRLHRVAIHWRALLGCLLGRLAWRLAGEDGVRIVGVSGGLKVE